MSESAGETVRDRAMRLLGLIRDATEDSGTPVFAENLAAQAGWSTEQLRAAFRYLADKGWVDTFSIPYTGRINASGQDELETHPATAPVTPVPAAHDWDAFLSHAGEDKVDIATPLAEALRARGVRVWLDALVMTVGDSLSRSIDAGLARSRFGIVVLSPEFFAKEWPRRELDGLVAREVAGQKVILPVWHRIDKSSVLKYSPTLADRVAAQSSKGIDAVADALVAAIEKGGQTLTGRAVASSQPTQPSQDANGEAFHRRRAAEIVGGNSPAKLKDKALLILHLIPQEALSGRSSAKFEGASSEGRGFLPIGSQTLQDSRINTDGLIIGSDANGLQVEQRAYSFVFRSGAVESVASSILRGHRSDALPLPWLQTVITDQALRILRALSAFDLLPPYHVHVSLSGVGGVRLLQQWPEGAFVEDMPFGELGEGIQYFDSVVLDRAPVDRGDCFDMLRPVLIHLANAAGLRAPPPLI